VGTGGDGRGVAPEPCTEAAAPPLAMRNVTLVLFTSAKEDMQSSLFVCLSFCLSVSNFAQKLPNGFA